MTAPEELHLLDALAGRSLLTVADLNPDEAIALFHLAAGVKREPLPFSDRLRGEIMVLLFEKPSLRTRVTFEAAMVQLGGHPIFLDCREGGIAAREAVKDVANNLGRWSHVIAARTFRQATLEELAEHASIPVVNALSEREHPCQALADLFTIRECREELEGLRLAFLGDGNNVCCSLILLSALLGVQMVVASPTGYEPPTEVLDRAAALSGGCRPRVLHDPAEAVRDADVVYTDVWVSMGSEPSADERYKDFRGFTVDRNLLRLAADNAIVMHCLPAHRGEEITDGVIDGPQSVVLQQAENRLHVQKALVLALRGACQP